MNYIVRIFAQIPGLPTPDQVVKGVNDSGPLWLTSAAVIGLLVVCAALFTRLSNKEAKIAELHENYGKQIATLKESYGDRIATLERANGQEIKTMLSTWNTVTNNIERTLERLVDTMERPPQTKA